MIYLDNHATTQVDPRVIETLVTMVGQCYANAGSVTHEGGRAVAERVAAAAHSIGRIINSPPEDLVFTSGATESNNLALLGVCTHARNVQGGRNKIITLQTEHRAVLDPVKRLEQLGFEVVRLGVQSRFSNVPGAVDLDQLSDEVDERTLLVSIMLANNEIGVIQPMADIASICHKAGAFLHSDATQAVGRMDVDVESLQVDLLSFSAHKFYGPKGVGGLYVRRSPRRIRLQPLLYGGGQQDNRRPGTLNSPGIVAMAHALEISHETRQTEWPRIRTQRDLLFHRLQQENSRVQLNGPELESRTLRLEGNLNCSFLPVEGQSLMLMCPELAVSSGSACTSTESRPSHVLLALGLTEEEARSSLRFGIGRFTTDEDILIASQMISIAMKHLERLV